MLFRFSDGMVFLLPALPARLTKRAVRGITFPKGTVDIVWNDEKISAVIHAREAFTAQILLKDTYVKTISLKAGEEYSFIF